MPRPGTHQVPSATRVLHTLIDGVDPATRAEIPEGNAHRARSVFLPGPWSRLLAGIVLLALLPFVVPPFMVSIATQVLAFAVLAGSLHILLGWAGMPSLGQAGYFGMGAYAVGLTAINFTTSAPVLLLVAAVVGGLSAALTGWMVVRSAGGYLLMITIAIGELLAHTAESWDGLTGGDNGLAAIPFTTIGNIVLIEPVSVYWYALVIFALCLVVMFLIGRSPFGRTLRGIRDNEARMRSLGYATYMHKYAVYTLAGSIAGVAGALWVAHAQFVSPQDLSVMQSAMVLIAVCLGGTKGLWGPLAGASIVVCAQYADRKSVV